MSLRKWATPACALMFLFLIVALSKISNAQLSLYDNFRSAHIDPSKWAVPGAVTEVFFDMVIKSAVAVGCNSNPNGQIVTGAELRGRYFNTESSPTSQLGDVEAVIGANRNATDTGSAMEVLGFYQRCDDANCSARTTLGFNRLGFIQPGAVAALHIKWDQPNHQFVFQLNNGPLVFSPYSVSDTAQPFFGPFRSIDLARVVPHCTTTPRPFASIDAFFSNVRVNPTAVP